MTLIIAPAMMIKVIKMMIMTIPILETHMYVVHVCCTCMLYMYVFFLMQVSIYAHMTMWCHSKRSRKCGRGLIEHLRCNQQAWRYYQEWKYRSKRGKFIHHHPTIWVILLRTQTQPFLDHEGSALSGVMLGPCLSMYSLEETIRNWKFMCGYPMYWI